MKFWCFNVHVPILLPLVDGMVNIVLHGQVDAYGVPQNVSIVRNNVHSVVL